MLTILRNLELFPSAMEVTTFRAVARDKNLWKQITLSRVPASSRITFKSAPRPEFISEADLQKKSPPGAHAGKTQGLTRSILKMHWAGSQQLWTRDGSGFFRFSGSSLLLKMTIRVWLPRQYQPGMNEKSTIIYGLLMGHELEHVQDTVSIFYNTMTPDKILGACYLLRTFCAGDSSGEPQRISGSDRDRYFKPTIACDQGNGEPIDHLSLAEDQIFQLWKKEKEPKTALVDNMAGRLLHESNFTRAERGDFAAIQWPVGS